MFCGLIERFSAWRVRVGQQRALAVVDGRTLADVGLNRAAVTAALAGNGVLVARQRFD